MRKVTLHLLFLLGICGSVMEKKYAAEKSFVSFYSHATVEDITAENTKSVSMFNSETGDIVFAIPIGQFMFAKSLMKEHFNEKYMETEKIPKSTFQGKISGFDPKATGPQTAKATGKLSIHGVTKDVELPGTIEVNGQKLILKSTFIVKLDDYSIQRPTLLLQNIAEQVEVKIEFDLQAIMKTLSTLIMLCFSVQLLAQDDLMKELEKSQQPEITYVTSTFKGTHIVNGQTVETKGKGALEFIFAHRFGAINEGFYNLYGLDNAHVRIGLEYGITDRLGISFGRSSLDKTMDGFLRYKLLRQSSGLTNMPVTITAYGNAALKTSPREEDVDYTITTEDRMSYTGQLLIARKFNSSLSLQLMPTIVHKNMVDKTIEENDQFALGMGGRLKVTRSVALTAEYYYRLNVMDTNPYYNAVGVGIDIETGGHVFQLVLTNTQGLTERAFVTETTGDISNGDIHMGFNITRTFQLKKQK